MNALAAALDDPSDYCFFRAPGRVNLMGDHTDYNECVQTTYGASGRQTRSHPVLPGGDRKLKRRPRRTEERGG